MEEIQKYTKHLKAKTAAIPIWNDPCALMFEEC